MATCLAATIPMAQIIFPKWEISSCFPPWEKLQDVMRVIALFTLKAFWTDHPRSEEAFAAWYKVAEKAQWQSPADVLSAYPTADVVGDNRIIFNIRGNEFRLIVHFKYRAQIAMVCFVGTHKQYDKINPETV